MKVLPIIFGVYLKIVMSKIINVLIHEIVEKSIKDSVLLFEINPDLHL